MTAGIHQFNFPEGMQQPFAAMVIHYQKEEVVVKWDGTWLTRLCN